MNKQITYQKIISILLLLFVVQLCSAQLNANKGDRYFDKNLFREAIKYYELEIKNGKKNTIDYAMIKLADCYRLLGEFELAEETYKKILKKKRNQEDPFNYINYGKTLKNSAKYAEAKEQFEIYIKMKPEDKMGPILLHSCDSAQLWLEQTLGKEVTNVEKINTEYSDFSPLLVNNSELIFSSSRPESKKAFVSFNGGLEVDRMDIYKIDLYKLSEEKKVNPINFGALNSALHEGAATFSIDGNEVYFTRTVKGTKDKNKNQVLSSLQIFYSKKDTTGKWTEPVSAFSFNNHSYSVGHPSLSKDGQTLYFISDMPSGYGGTDIYYIEKNEAGEWVEEPINMGSEINTFRYELFPFIAANGVLYFSSDGHYGMGQLDILSTKKQGKSWKKPTNLKPPFNSIGNDFGIVIDDNYFRGFFSSDRFNGVGAEDIYSFSEEEVPATLNITKNELRIKNNSIFDGIEYKLIYSEAETEQEIKAQLDGEWFLFNLKENIKYTLSIRQNRMPYNKIYILLARNETNYLDIEIESESKDFNLEGTVIKTTTNPDTNETTEEIIKNAGIKVNANKNLSLLNANNGKFNLEIKSATTYKLIAR